MTSIITCFQQGFRNLIGVKQTILLFCILCAVSSFSQNKKWTLQECVDHALENNISIKQAHLDSEIAKENIVSSKGDFLPNLNGSASKSFNFGSFIDNNGGRISSDSRGNSFGLNTGVTLFDGFRNIYSYKQSKLGLESSKIQLEVLTSNISLNIANAYLNILLNKENLKITLDQMELTQKQLDQVKSLVEYEVKPKSDLFDVEAQLATDNERVVNAQNNLDLSLLSLSQLLQISHVGFDIQEVLLEVSSVALGYDNTEDIYTTAEASRPEIKKANLEIENSVLGIKIAKSTFMPSLSFGAGMGTSYQHRQGEEDLRPIIDPNDPNNIIFVENGFGTQLKNNLGYNVGFNLRIPIFNGFKTKANVSRSVIAKQKSELRLEQEKQTLRTNIEQAYADAKAALNQYVASEQSVNAQKEAFKNAQERYNLGVITAFDYEQIKNRLINAQSSLINAKYNFVFKTKVLDFYTGKPISIN